jgi:hypothetical protein
MAFNPDAYLKSKASESAPKGFNPDAYLASKGKGPSEGDSALRGAISGATAGFDDEITGGLGAVGRVFGIKNLGSAKPFDPNSHYEMASEPLSIDEIVKAYRENRDAVRDEQRADMSANPKSTIAGNLVGSIISPASKIGFGSGSRLANAVKTGAAQGAVFGAGTSDSDLTKGEVGKFALDTALGAGTGAAVPVALKGLGKAAGAAADAGKWAGKKAFSSAFGVAESNVDKYLANPERINNAKSFNEIKELVDESVGKLRDAVEQGKVTEAQAKTSLQSLQDQVTRGLSDKKIDAKDALRAAETMFGDAKEKALLPLRSKAAPTDRAADVAAMAGDLKSKVIEESGQALSTLKPGQRVDLSGVYNSIDDSLDRLKSAGTDQADAVAAKLQAYKTRLMSQNWAKIDAPDAKKLIQGLDEITTYSPMQGSFDQASNKVFKGVRGALDSSLKEGSPEYRAAMEPVAQKANLLNDANSAFGAPEVAVGKLAKLNTPRGEFDRATLAQLEEAVGKPGFITKDADAYAQAQRILKDPEAVRKIEQSLPEYQNLRQAMADVAKRNPKWTRAQVEQATADQRRALAEATGKRIFAEKQLAPFKSITEANSEGRLNSLMRGEDRGINNREIIENLGKKSGKDFIQMADDLSVKNSFEKGATNGSRNTLFYSILGGAFGGIPGAVGGATFGSQVIDRYGPKVGKAILDGVIKIKNNPTVQTIRSLSLPPEVKSELEREFNVYMITKNAGESGPSKVAETTNDNGRSPSQLRGESLWAQKGLAKLGIEDEAMATQLLNSKDGKRLLIEASDLSPGSKRLKTIKDQLSKGRGN